MTLTKFLNLAIKIAVTLPFFFWIFGIFNDWLGVEPIVKINTQSGYVVLILLLVNLLIGAIHALHWIDIKWYRFLQMSRRYIGVFCGLYAILHFFSYLGKESFLPKGWEQIVTKNYLTFGAFAAVIILILAITSNNFSTRLLKNRWKKLHRLVYLAGIVAMFHIFQIEKANLVLLGLLVAPVIALEAIRLISNIVQKNKRPASP